MTAYTDTLTLSDGTRVEMVSTRTPQQRARYEHLCRLFGCWELRPTDDGMTAADWQQAQARRAERNQAADDAATYGTNRPDAWGVGY